MPHIDPVTGENLTAIRPGGTAGTKHRLGECDAPEGSVVVKENFMPDSTLAAVTTMYRVRAYNPEHQDWFFAKHDPPGVVEVAGRDPMCQACHAGAPGMDYLFTELPR